ncbi:MAG: hypothetical protein IPM35_37685 [Myxococcales bacterium]|nr:hypothetical protein [Myxococcales bacterium]
MRSAFVVLIVGGALSLALGIRTWVLIGRGSGFEGCAPGFRLRLHVQLLLSVALIAAGAYGLSLR